MKVKRAVPRAAVALLGVAGFSTAGAWSAAGADILEPALTAESSGVAVEVDGIIAIGETSATAGSTGGSATGYAIQIGDSEPPAQLGGTQTGSGTSSGNLLDTGATPLGQVQVTPWSATVSSGGTTTSDSSAALARVDVLDPSVAGVDVLQSSSHAEYTAARSSGSSSSDGAVVTVGDQLTLRLLHAEASSDDVAKSYLVGINDTAIGSSGDVNGNCVVSVPSLLDVVCLNASGGIGKAASEVLHLVIGGDGGLGAGVVGAATSGGGAGTEVLPTALVPSSNLGEVSRAPGTSTLPFTGADTWFVLAAGLAFLSLGATVTAMGRLRPAVLRVK